MSATVRARRSLSRSGPFVLELPKDEGLVMAPRLGSCTPSALVSEGLDPDRGFDGGEARSVGPARRR